MEIIRYIGAKYARISSDPLAWWKDNEQCYPQLAKCARILLAVPATSCESERLFSHMGLLLEAPLNGGETDIQDPILLKLAKEAKPGLKCQLEFFNDPILETYQSLYDELLLGTQNQHFMLNEVNPEDVQANSKRILIELALVLENILAILHCGIVSVESATNFKKLFTLFSSSNFGLQFHEWFPSQQFLQRMCLLQTVILIRTASLDHEALFDQDCKPPLNHFLFDQELLCSILYKIDLHSSKSNYHGPLKLFAAVCGLTFASSEGSIVSMETGPKASLSKLVEKLATTAIRECDVFTYMTECDPDGRNRESNLISLLNLFSNMAFFDLLALLGKKVALQSLGGHRELYLKALFKRLKFAVNASSQCSLPFRFAVSGIIDELTQAFPRDYSLLNLLTSLIDHQENADNQLVIKFLKSVPYFCDFYPSNDIPVLPRFPFFRNESSQKAPENRFCIPKGTQASVSDSGCLVWQFCYSIWPVFHGLLAQLNNSEEPILQENLITLLKFLVACAKANIESSCCMQLLPKLWNLFQNGAVSPTIESLALLLNLTGQLAPHGINYANRDHRALQHWHAACKCLDRDQRILLHTNSSPDQLSKLHNAAILGPFSRLSRSKFLDLVTSPSNVLVLLTSYADFLAGLLTAEKLVYSTGTSSALVVNDDAESPYQLPNMDLLVGGIVFLVDVLLSTSFLPSSAAKIFSSLTPIQHSFILSSLDPRYFVTAINPSETDCVTLFEIIGEDELHASSLIETVSLSLTMLELLLDNSEQEPLHVIKILQAGTFGRQEVADCGYTIYLLFLLSHSLHQQLRPTLSLAVLNLLKRLLMTQYAPFPVGQHHWAKSMQILPGFQEFDQILVKFLRADVAEDAFEHSLSDLIRCNLLDLLSECILCSESASPLVKILCRDVRFCWTNAGSSTSKLMKAAGDQISKFDLINFILCFFSENESVFNETDHTRLSLKVAVYKLLSSLWIRGSLYSYQIQRIRQSASPSFWVHLNKPLVEFYASSGKSAQEKAQFLEENAKILELFSHQMTLLALEYYAIEKDSLPDYIDKSLVAFTSSVCCSFLEVFLKNLDSSAAHLDQFWTLLSTCFVRFKCLLSFCHSLKFPNVDIADLMTRLFAVASKVFVLMKSAPATVHLHSLADEISALTMTLLMNMPLQDEKRGAVINQVYPQLVSMLVNIASLEKRQFHVNLLALLNYVLWQLNPLSTDEVESVRLNLLFSDVACPAIVQLLEKGHYSWSKADIQFLTQLLYLVIGVFHSSENSSKSYEILQHLASLGVVQNLILLYPIYRKDVSKIDLNQTLLDFFGLLLRIPNKELNSFVASNLKTSFCWPDQLTRDGAQLTKCEMSFVSATVDQMKANDTSVRLLTTFVETNFETINMVATTWAVQLQNNNLHGVLADIISTSLLETSSIALGLIWRLCRFNSTLSGGSTWTMALVDRVLIHAKPVSVYWEKFIF
ncbi:hypothetical protein Ciccas_001945 [Cichlidogyrus casuarinus]|uniref:HAT C-terminal dimerisation domain-containing protein n=1 Tax=Cichlidogyrus casuarinus TaxID=1844966 RepID=A0ABD2QIN1_9PLAT